MVDPKKIRYAVARGAEIQANKGKALTVSFFFFFFGNFAIFGLHLPFISRTIVLRSFQSFNFSYLLFNRPKHKKREMSAPNFCSVVVP